MAQHLQNEMGTAKCIVILSDGNLRRLLVLVAVAQLRGAAQEVAPYMVFELDVGPAVY